jgi:type II secretion system protein E
MGKELIGQLLIKEGKISEEVLEQALREQEKTGEHLGDILIRLGYITRKEILQALSLRLNLPYIELSKEDIDPKVIAKVPAKFVYHHKLIPLKEEKGVLTVAVGNPLNIHALDDLRLLLGCKVSAVISNQEDIMDAIKEHYGVGAETVEKMVEESKADLEIVESEDKESEDLEDMSSDASVIKFVNQIILEAFRDGATDIHIEPFEERLRIRYRIDGLLHETSIPPTIKQFQSAIISRIKVMANLNVAEKRVPQDGRIKLKISNREVDLRISTVPTLHGESVDMRILDKSKFTFGLEQLGLEKESLKKFISLVSRPHGIILVTGPTGCGKTTTLYASLSRINSIEKNIITIEDPIEYNMEGINQIQVKPEIALTFTNGLRSILRQDPDIIMVGEIRDYETAEIAIRAALTGHLVFSTLHTNDASGAVTRLLDMNVEPYLVSSSVEGVLAQRLVRTICSHCKESYEVDANSLREMGFPAEQIPKLTLYRGKGCPECKDTGYKGRTGIFELFLVAEEVKPLILEKVSTERIKEKARALGMKTLKEDGWEKARAGITTVEEVLRVAEEETPGG